MSVPESDPQSQAQAGGNFYWSNGSNAVGTNGYQSPGVNFTPLKQVW